MADMLIPESTPCTWHRAWIGQCNAPSDNGRCTKHEGKVCASCGAPAVRECDHTGIQFVCGAPLCATCEHGYVMPGESTGMFALGGGHVIASVAAEQAAEYWARFDGSATAVASPDPGERR